MKRSNYLIFGILALILAAGGTSFAQSMDRDNPTPLTSGEISGSMNDHNREAFYSFTAGPGEVTITLDVNANTDEQGVLNFDVLARNGATSLACCYFAQGNGGGTGREVANFKLAKRQVVILHTTNGPIGGGTFHIRLNGATSFSGGAVTRGGGGYNDNGGYNHDNDGEQARGDRRGDQIEVPATGILHIRMKNGMTQDINLNLVKSISVRQ